MKIIQAVLLLSMLSSEFSMLSSEFVSFQANCPSLSFVRVVPSLFIYVKNTSLQLR